MGAVVDKKQEIMAKIADAVDGAREGKWVDPILLKIYAMIIDELEVPKMTPERHAEILKRLKELGASSKHEEAHIEADNLVSEFLPDDIADAYSEIEKWYS